jgi:putative transcriptional regulator
MERVGGALVADTPAAKLAPDALNRTLSRLGETAPSLTPTRAETADAPSELPGFVRRYAFGTWRSVAPRIHIRPILLPEPSPTRVFLLKAAPKTTLLDHGHTALEMTCVLRGGFRHEGGRFGPGDFDFGDQTVWHAPRVEADDECLCLVAMQGGLRWTGFRGLLARAFVRL